MVLSADRVDIFEIQYLLVFHLHVQQSYGQRVLNILSIVHALGYQMLEADLVVYLQFFLVSVR